MNEHIDYDLVIHDYSFMNNNTVNYSKLKSITLKSTSRFRISFNKSNTYIQVPWGSYKRTLENFKFYVKDPTYIVKRFSILQQLFCWGAGFSNRKF
jgi:hypothetical protein